ncbi:unnamed protein product [Medioppia subpectinata]|uniref:EF-hand domain-containing protein n=1 Tax=Medioppia subpectinata TaxID=1979941 RepID=A0A7R9KXP6_9ACAR|nr:unnamed protein product [Medioppia subpectinata]CAG2111435.1 unnamed protein product [Medioppia subpectinata]
MDFIYDSYDSEGFGRITSEDFLLILNTKDFRDVIDDTKRAHLKAKVLEYGTSFITREEFLNVIQRIIDSNAFESICIVLKSKII